VLIAAALAGSADCDCADCAALAEIDWADGADLAAACTPAAWAALADSICADGATGAACAVGPVFAAWAAADAPASIPDPWAPAMARDGAAMQATATRTAGVEYFSLAKFLDMFLSRDFITDAPGQ
jgi:hypothetical protein